MSNILNSTILVVDDDEHICRILNHFLSKEGYIVETTTLASEAIILAKKLKPDLMILDLMFPDGDGFGIIRELDQESDAAIIVLSGKDSSVDMVVGLEIGADDYITKPFNQRELLARVRSVLRRHQANIENKKAVNNSNKRQTLARFNGWEFDMTNSELRSAEGESVHLTSHEYQLLTSMIENSDRVISRDEMLELLSGREWNPYDRSIDVMIAKLRKKIKDDCKDHRIIMTFRGQGYRFVAPVEYC
jgi:two-component system, OmpR family, response regulator